MGDSPVEKPMCLEVPKLVIPLCHNPQSILIERDYDQEPADSGQMRFQRLRIYLDGIFDLFSNCSNPLERMVWVSCSVTCRRA